MSDGALPAQAKRRTVVLRRMTHAAWMYTLHALARMPCGAAYTLHGVVAVQCGAARMADELYALGCILSTGWRSPCSLMHYNELYR